MTTLVNYYSAEIAKPNSKFPYQRIRIRNRHDPAHFIDYRWKKELGDAIDAQIRSLYHSPVLTVETMWYDAHWEMYFFRVTEKLNSAFGAYNRAIDQTQNPQHIPKAW
jgi:hypothetical protein